MTVLNHAGLCTSNATAWKYLKQLTQESMYLEIIREGCWLWIYDNLNLHQKIRHERLGTCNEQCALISTCTMYYMYVHVPGNYALLKCIQHTSPDYHSSMLNLTSRLAVKIKNLPAFEFDWADTTPQRLRTSLNVDDFLPSEADATVLHQRAVHYMLCTPCGDVLKSQASCRICS